MCSKRRIPLLLSSTKKRKLYESDTNTNVSTNIDVKMVLTKDGKVSITIKYI